MATGDCIAPFQLLAFPFEMIRLIKLQQTFLFANSQKKQQQQNNENKFQFFFVRFRLLLSLLIWTVACSLHFDGTKKKR